MNEQGAAMFKKKVNKISYDKENLKPILKCSICNGEQVAGFKNIHTGKFEDVMLIKDIRDLDKFMEMYDISTLEKEY